MEDKIRLLEAAYNKVILDRSFMAYHLSKYLVGFGIEKYQTILDYFQITDEDLYKFGLCSAPDKNRRDFGRRCEKIAEYCGIPWNFIILIIDYEYTTSSPSN